MLKYFTIFAVLMTSVFGMASSQWKCLYQFEGLNVVTIDYRMTRPGNLVPFLTHVNSQTRTYEYNFTASDTDLKIKSKLRPGYSPMKDWGSIEFYSSISKRNYVLDIANGLVNITNKLNQPLLGKTPLKCTFSGGGE